MSVERNGYRGVVKERVCNGDMDIEYEVRVSVILSFERSHRTLEGEASTSEDRSG